jgi:hypothetical protein
MTVPLARRHLLRSERDPKFIARKAAKHALSHLEGGAKERN